ncbi:sigma-70 family RNA polymerase sigma factor [Radicibacter daui]|uniref:sigma-70 family RNA polymerase sigma factor n=1 Tax=Radicibacter daui TaxID=3064829 RepID=UPI004046FDEC
MARKEMVMAEDEEAGGQHAAGLDFEQYRRYLTGLAYRMLGSLSEAEDAVQDAWLRWVDADRSAIANPRAWLARVVTRLCVDQLRSARARRESYVGAWLPEPLADSQIFVPEESAAELASDLSVALLLALERLSPLERAAFLLHDVFDLDFREVAETLGRDEAAVRQLASRARRHVADQKPRFDVAPAEGEAIARAFEAASRAGDVSELKSLLAANATLMTDGGGIRPSAINPIFGMDRICRFFAGLVRKHGRQERQVVRYGLFNGLPGYLSIESDGIPQVTMLEISAGHIGTVYIVRNPEKLSQFMDMAPPAGTA